MFLYYTAKPAKQYVWKFIQAGAPQKRGEDQR